MPRQHAGKPLSLAVLGHCPQLSRVMKAEDDCGIWNEIECCLLYPAQLLHVVFEMRARTKESPSRHRPMIFPIYHDERSFHSYLLWEGGNKSMLSPQRPSSRFYFFLCRRIDTMIQMGYIYTWASWLCYML